MASRNKSSVIALMFYDGKYALLSIVPRGNEHHRHRKQYNFAICYPFWWREIHTRLTHPVMRDIFFHSLWSKARSDLCTRYSFPGACFRLLEEAKYLFLSWSLWKDHLMNLNSLINLKNLSTHFKLKYINL